MKRKSSYFLMLSILTLVSLFLPVSFAIAANSMVTTQESAKDVPIVIPTSIPKATRDALVTQIANIPVTCTNTSCTGTFEIPCGKNTCTITAECTRQGSTCTVTIKTCSKSDPKNCTTKKITLDCQGNCLQVFACLAGVSLFCEGPSEGNCGSSLGSPGTAFAVNPNCTPTSRGTATPPGPAKTTNMTVLFGDWADNTPPGPGIAYPNQKHSQAGGVGTHDDPITFAASAEALKPGTIIYVPSLKKYFVMEDDCDTCRDAWSGSQTYEIVIWIGGDANSDAQKLTACAESLTSDTPIPVEMNPPANRKVDKTPLFTNSGGCIKP